MKTGNRINFACLALFCTLLAPDWLLAADVPPMGGGYTNVTPVAVNDPTFKQIAGALMKPQGAGPFPVVVYIPPCGGPNFPLELQQEKFWIETLSSKGIATFIVDPFVPRGLQQGNCDKLLTVLSDVQNKNEAVLKILNQGRDDTIAAVKAVKAMPDIDPQKIFVMGFSYGATASLHATAPEAPDSIQQDVAGVVAYYPLCDKEASTTVPTLVFIGDKDDWTGPVSSCEALKGKSNYEIITYAGATHAFTLQFDKPVEFAGHKLAFDKASTADAAQNAQAFIENLLK